jgi:hypothetical protein
LPALGLSTLLKCGAVVVRTPMAFKKAGKPDGTALFLLSYPRMGERGTGLEPVASVWSLLPVDPAMDGED